MNITKTKNERINSLLSNIKSLREIESIRNDSAVMDTLAYLEGRLNDDTFRISAVGEFSSGKSTFINALIGRDLLLHARTETTAAITYIQNVGADDKRNGTGEVILRSGRKITLKDLNELGNYTTVQSGNNVAEEIDHVTVYVNFLATDYPVVITDTPGFNGNKAHHSDISISEIKRTHACIYLIGIRGITNSDAELIKHLLDYQNTFFLLQNFKDEFNASEGDTIEKKLEEAERVVKQSIIPGSRSFNYKLIGISALQAMAAKDKSVKFLKEGSTREINDSDRQRMLDTSGILELENALTELINSGEYLNIIADSAEEVMAGLLDTLISDINRQQVLNEELRASSDEQKRIDAAAKLRKNIEASRDDKKVRLENFIVARSDEQQRALKSDITESSSEVYSKVEEMIDKDFNSAMKNFDSGSDLISYDELIRRQKGKGATAYYTQKTLDMLNELQKKLNGRIKLFVEHLYEEAVARVREDTKVNVGNNRLDLKIEPEKKSFEMDTSAVATHEDIIREYRGQINNLQDQMNNLNRASAMLNSKLTDKRRSLPGLQTSARNLEADYENKIRALGSMPPVRTYERSEIRYRKRPTKIGQFFWGDEKYTHYWTEYDDSEQSSWKSSKRRIVSEYEPLMEQANTSITECSSEIDMLNGHIEDNNIKIRRIEKRIADLHEDIRQENETYEELKRSARKKYIEWQKNAMKKNLEMKLRGEGNSESVGEWFSTHISTTYKRYMPDIIAQLLRTYHLSVEKRLIEIDRMMNENTAELEKRFQSNEDDLRRIMAIRQTMAKNKEE